MKKTIYILICFAIFLTGCNQKSSEVTAVTTGLSFTAEITEKNSTYKCTAVIKPNGDTTFKILKPEKIKGLTFNFSKNSYSMEFLDLKSNRPSQFDNTSLNLIYKAFLTANNKNEVTFEKDKFILNGNTENHNFIFTLGESGLPLSLEFPNNDLKIIFKNCSINN